MANGPAHGTPLSKQLNLLSLSERENLKNMESTLKGISLLKSHLLIKGSSSMNLQSATKLEEVRTYYSQTPTISPDSTWLLSCLTELNLITQGLDPSVHLEKQTQRLKSVTALTPLMVNSSNDCHFHHACK